MDTGTLVGILTGMGGACGGAIKILWSYWTKREAEKREAWKGIVDGKDEIIKQKDDRITELGKNLSKKSDEHAAKIEQLMGLTLEEVSKWSTKLEAILERSHTVQAEFGAEVRSFTAELPKFTEEIRKLLEKLDNMRST